jgi:hypothetical protein
MPSEAKAPAETVDLSGDVFDLTHSIKQHLRVIPTARFGVHLKQINSTT